MLTLNLLSRGALHDLRVSGRLDNRWAKYYRWSKTGQRQLFIEPLRWGRVYVVIVRALMH